MRFFVDKAEEKALNYVRTYTKHTIYTHVAFIRLSEATEIREKTRAELSSYFRQILEDPKSLVFYFANKDVLVFSDKMTNHHVFKILRHFGLHSPVERNFYKLPQNGECVEELVSRYIEKSKGGAALQVGKISHISKRDRFMGVEISSNLHTVIDKLRQSRKDNVVLVIDDDPFATNLINCAVGKTHTVIQAHDALDGFKKYAKYAPDIIFLDINMPSVSGFDFLTKIFQLDPQAYVVIISGDTNAANQQRAAHSGAKGFIAKPFSPDDLFRFINQSQRECA
ncbi:MAG: response regulator [Alphaproteobacteria bacterium]|nr:response regulator [Alphaproteobacteria bacterium]